jgi:hypothetical protein
VSVGRCGGSRRSGGPRLPAARRVSVVDRLRHERQGRPLGALRREAVLGNVFADVLEAEEELVQLVDWAERGDLIQRLLREFAGQRLERTGAQPLAPAALAACPSAPLCRAVAAEPRNTLQVSVVQARLPIHAATVPTLVCSVTWEEPAPRPRSRPSMAPATHGVERAGGNSPRRLVVVAVLTTFWATLLLALGVPGAGPILLAALGGSAMVAVRRLLAGRSPTVRRVRVQPALRRLATLARGLRPRVRLPRALPRVTLPALPVVRMRVPAAVGALRARSVRPPDLPAPFGEGRAGEAWRFCRLGAQLRRDGRLAAAVESFETAVWIFRDLDEPHGLALALNGLGLALVRQRRLDAAVARYQEAAEILERVDDRHAQGQVLANLGTALRSQGRSDEALASWDDALARLEPGSAEHVRIRELRAV